jgi:sugar fermentation stimulation protein A
LKYSPELKQGTLLKRYKRFLTDVSLPDGKQITIHCPNTGSMKNCCPENAPVWFSTSDNAKRKYPHTWELVEDPKGNKIGINTHLANTLVVEALEAGKIKALQPFKTLRTEVKYGRENSRIDILLENKKGGLHYVEVKSVTLLEDDNWGCFPDAKSLRGQKHLRELMQMVKEGHKASLLFCVQHTGIKRVKAARHIDPEYADLLKQAQQAGVQVLAYGCDISEKEISLQHKLKCRV